MAGLLSCKICVAQFVDSKQGGLLCKVCATVFKSGKYPFVFFQGEMWITQRGFAKCEKYGLVCLMPVYKPNASPNAVATSKRKRHYALLRTMPKQYHPKLNASAKSPLGVNKPTGAYRRK